MTGSESVVVEHGEALRAIAGRAVNLPPPAVANITCGVGNLPAIEECDWIFTFSQYSSIR